MLVTRRAQPFHLCVAVIALLAPLHGFASGPPARGRAEHGRPPRGARGLPLLETAPLESDASEEELAGHVAPLHHEGGDPGKPKWAWRPILSSPRIGGRLTAVAADPRDCDRIFVGTEEGTIVRTTDGGVTWDERPLSPFVVQARSIGTRGAPSPDVEEAASERFELSFDPPGRIYGDDLPPTSFEPLAFSLFPPFILTGFPPYVVGASPPETLLSDTVESRLRETIPVRRIVLCPGATFPLLVATPRELYGSTDEGLTSLRLYFVSGDLAIEHVACSPWNPNEIALSTGAGLFRSTNGGLTFDPVLTGHPGQPSTSVAFGREPTHNVTIVYETSNGELYRGDPESMFGLQYLYPEGDPETAPWEEIRWIEVLENGEIWLATDDGARVSRDRGKTFKTVAPLLLRGHPVLQVIAGRSEGARPRLLILLKDVAYSSDDGGASWHPFFHGITRRSFRQVARGPGGASDPIGSDRWYVVTSGELWATTSAPAPRVGEPIAASRARDWAERRLRATPPLGVVLDRVLAQTELSNAQLEQLTRAHRARAYVPIIDLRATVLDDARRRFETEAITNPRDVREEIGRLDFEIFVQATWPFYDALAYSEEVGSVRGALYELRRQIAFAAEDAWHERTAHLERMAAGIGDEQQIEILSARIAALETVLDTWGWTQPTDTEGSK